MSQSFEEAIIRHCAATLAGHKCGSLFFHASCTAEDIDSANAAMNVKGVRVIPLRTCARGTLADVIAFIRNRGENCPLTGCWKAYTNEAAARKTFALYRKCRDVYLRCYARGYGVARLTVAA